MLSTGREGAKEYNDYDDHYHLKDKFADILGSDAKYKLFYLNLMHKVKTQRSGELFVKNMLIFNFLYGYN